MQEGTEKFNRCQSIKALVYSANSRKITLFFSIFLWIWLQELIFILYSKKDWKGSFYLFLVFHFIRKPVDHDRSQIITGTDSECTRVRGEAEEDYFTSEIRMNYMKWGVCLVKAKKQSLFERERDWRDEHRSEEKMVED